MKAMWNDKVLAESDDTIEIEGNEYFPKDSVNMKFLKESSSTSICPWKGEARYFDVIVDDVLNKDAAWYYPEPKDAAIEIKDHIAFWKGVEVSDE